MMQKPDTTIPGVPEAVANKVEAEEVKQAPSEVVPVAPPPVRKSRAWDYWTS
jgi:hypothetical protein